VSLDVHIRVCQVGSHRGVYDFISNGKRNDRQHETRAHEFDRPDHQAANDSTDCIDGSATFTKIFSAHDKMKDAVKLVAGLVALYVALTWSYSGYTSQSNMEDSVAARSLKTPYARP